ncbi:tyrosine-type DNA invertase [Trabulsiella odontotermitis]|uniref:tyrosine-type DNA invertase n=1 Tax=Trabulsiella odontotermitis TaxID=379893 RepID=UPI00092CE935|nr:tyrosine-type DNA invertase [Trabulsiella odontotermitis]
MNERKYLTRQEIQHMETATSTRRYAIRDRCLVRLCFIHGFRVSELRRVLLSDIDIEGRSIYIRRLKCGLSTIHPLAEAEIQILLAWLGERRCWRNADSPYLFISQKGDLLSRGYIHGLFRALGEEAELGIPVHPHMLRHACGYALADLGVDTRLIQDYLGHRNINHTVIYTATNHKRFCSVWKKSGM